MNTTFLDSVQQMMYNRLVCPTYVGQNKEEWKIESGQRKEDTMKSKVLKKIVAVCLIALIGSASCPITSFAKAPTIDTEVRKELTIGKTQITEKNYDGHEDTILCSFTAPETGKYRFKVTNNGDNSVDCYFLDEDRAIFDWRKYLDINSSYIFSDYSLKKDEKIYFYVETYSKLLATKIEIKQVKAVPSLNKTALSLKVKQTETLRLKNSNFAHKF